MENDVQRTRDGELVVVHDDTLRRTTDAEEVFPDRAPWKVKDFTAAEIARLDAGSWSVPPGRARACRR
ncbi:Hydrolase OS=Streptomyces fumanus OX=67302 GN=GCM10018772_65720 PE=4 SV=1 [Streptomyces fumanus]